MASIQNSIDRHLRSSLTIQLLTVENESNQHAGPADAETHFKIVCVAEEFTGLSRVRRHQHIYQILTHELENGVHALAMHLYTPAEWHERSGTPTSPQCLGGSTQSD